MPPRGAGGHDKARPRSRPNDIAAGHRHPLERVGLLEAIAGDHREQATRGRIEKPRRGPDQQLRCDHLRDRRLAGDQQVEQAGRAEIAGYVRDLRERPGRHGENVVALNSGAGLANATLQLRVTVIRLFYGFLLEEGVRDRNPVGRGYRSADGRAGRRGLVPRFEPLPWIPTEPQWRAVLEVVAGESLRNRLMFALAYDAALRREELCLLGTDDLDPSHRTITVRAETTKSRRSRVVPYSAVAGRLLAGYLSHRRRSLRLVGRCSCRSRRATGRRGCRRGRGRKVVRSIAVRAGVEALSTHTLRHLCLTDLARSDWELHAIATFAGHRSTDTTQRYIHLSGRDLADRLASGMSQIHAERIALIGEVLA